MTTVVERIGAYTVTEEFTGHDDPWFVARCDHHWVGEAPTKEGAHEIVCQHARGEG
jgi:hypothetical protein